MRFFCLIWLFIGFLVLSSCRSGGVVLRETPLSISETRRTVSSVIGEPRLVSPNGRELFSKFYDRRNRPIERLELAHERLYTLVTVLGDRRPYDVQVEVIIEERDDNGKFYPVDRSDEMAIPIAEKIKRALNQSLGSRNIIDDFRSF